MYLLGWWTLNVLNLLALRSQLLVHLSLLQQHWRAHAEWRRRDASVAN